ncbi:copper ion binding protein, partial [Rhizobium sp.]|uniref:heavy-metal-associated domain-containing protein n=1 Tax=Rhizobium sp. TaxID=391 RepID=UPI0028B0CA02
MSQIQVRASHTIAIDGMTCASCVGRVEKAIAKVPGVLKASVNLATERADISFSGPPDVLAVIDAVRHAGYSVDEKTIELDIEGMTCASCVGRVEKALKAVSGVADASVNLATERATVRVAGNAASAATLAEAIKQAGYKASEIAADTAKGDEPDRRETELRGLKISLTVAAILT